MRRILIMTGGLYPQIVTETLWALARRNPPFWPDKLIAVVTGKVESCYQTTLASAGGKLDDLCQALGRHSLWDRLEIRVLRDEQGVPIHDLRSDADAAAFGDFVAEIVRQETLDEDSIVHLSLAGGRKTMSFHAGAAMNLFGRVQDELSHVLVHPPELESNNFWWPLDRDEWITGRDGKSYNAREGAAKVELALIPFVRVRAHLPSSLLERQLRYGEYVAQINALVNGVTLELISETCTVRLPGLDLDFKLEKSDFALYWLMVEWAKARIEGAGPDGVGAGHAGWLTPEMIRDPQKFAEDSASGRNPVARFIELCEGVGADSTALNVSPAPSNAKQKKQNYETHIKSRLSKIRSRIQQAIIQDTLAEMLGAPVKTHTHPARFGLLLRPEQMTVRAHADGPEIAPFARLA